MVVAKAWFVDKMNTFLSEDESNRMSVDGSLILEPNVLVGFASGDDPIFEEFKKVVGSFHLTPREVHDWHCRKHGLTPSFDEVSVVAFILPINRMTKKEHLNYSEEWPSEKWAHTRLNGEKANKSLQRHLIEELKKEGIDAVSPFQEKEIYRHVPKYENGVWASTWSHRHMAFAAGLGSFGLSDGFISERGIAMRCGSLVVTHRLPSDAANRPSDPYAYCAECGTCIDRCPVDALSFEKRHDKWACGMQVFKTTRHIKRNYGLNIYACGLCQVGVPCQDGLPTKPLKE